MSEPYEVGTRSLVNDAINSAQVHAQESTGSNQVRVGQIVSADGAGWRVMTFDAAGNQCGVFERCMAVGDSTFTANQWVLLIFQDDAEWPVIAPLGGGSGGCLVATTAWGVLFG